MNTYIEFATKHNQHRIGDIVTFDNKRYVVVCINFNGSIDRVTAEDILTFAAKCVAVKSKYGGCTLYDLLNKLADKLEYRHTRRVDKTEFSE